MKRIILPAVAVLAVVVAAWLYLNAETRHPLIVALAARAPAPVPSTDPGADLAALLDDGTLGPNGELSSVPEPASAAGRRLAGLAAAREAAGGWLIVPGIDLFAGDLGALKVAAAEGCREACSEDPACTAFTWATMTHEVEGKRGSCWTKVGSRVTQLRVAPGYVSGLR